MIEADQLVFALLAIFLGGVVQSLTGFGFGIVAVPILSIFISPKLAAPITLLNSMALNAYILSSGYANVDLRRIWPLISAGLSGLPLGVWILVHWEVDALRIYIGAATVIFTVAFLMGFQGKVRRERLASLPIGFVSGVMAGSINM